VLLGTSPMATATAWVLDEPAIEEPAVSPQPAAKKRRATAAHARLPPQHQTERGAAGPPAAHANVPGGQEQDAPPIGPGPRVAIPISDGLRLQDVVKGGFQAFIKHQQGERKLEPISPRLVDLLFQENQFKEHGTKGNATSVELANMDSMRESMRAGVHNACQGARERFAEARTYAPLPPTRFTPRPASRR
jgi:hypothetical protein